MAQVNDFDVAGWTPSLSAMGGYTFNDTTGTVTTSDVLGPSSQGIDPIIQPASSANSTPIAPFLGGGLQLMSPHLSKVSFGRPRIFLHAEIGAAFSQEDDLTRSKDPAPRLSIPDLFLDDQGQPSGARIPPESVLGQGTRTSVNIEPLVFSGGLGMAFEAQIFDRIIRIKPSVEYLAQHVQASGIVSRAVQLVDVPRSLDDYRHVLLEERRTKRFHSVGAGLELETDAARFGAMVVSVFASARGYKTLGSREIALAAFNSADPDPQAQQENARWTVKLDEWALSTAVGVRLHWSPER